jgi:signal transduction histidine kinase
LQPTQITEHPRDWRAKVVDFFSRQSSRMILGEAFLLTLVIGYLDYITGYEISLVVFYAIPILFAVWFGDKSTSIFIALLCALVWWWADVKAGHPYLMNWVQTYNMVVCLVFFLFVAHGGGALKAQLELLERTQRLEREIIKISEREQQRIGQDLHDGLCQYLAAISCAASSLRNDLQKKLSPEAEAAAEIADLLKQGVTQTRNLSRGLFPVQMDEAGLESALDELASSACRLLSIECEFESIGHVPIYDNSAATHLYRISQEALNNATRHGHATKVSIILMVDDDVVILSIADNGKGLPKTTEKIDGMGLKIMDYRTNLIAGQLEVANNPGGGVIVTCSFRQSRKPMEGEKN